MSIHAAEAPESNDADTPDHAAVLPRVLVIDREPAAMVGLLHPTLATVAYRVETAASCAAALARIAAVRPDVIVLDADLPDACGPAVHDRIQSAAPDTPVLRMAPDTGADAAILAVRQGAFDYLAKPTDGRRLHRAIEAALAARPRQERSLPLAAEDPDAMLWGDGPAMRQVFKAIGLVAARPVGVLITGESGTGKELVTRAIVRHSDRARRPFLALNCAAIPEHLLESELFGHERGAFSGADRRRVGKFEQCDGGTILLDEIGDMPLPLQAKVLRLIQEQAFERVGGHETIKIDVRLIAATHRDLPAMAAAGAFRADLYFRLGVFGIRLPPLRERPEDLPLLVGRFLRQYGRAMGRDIDGISEAAMARLARYRWPGNVRELQNVLQQALLRCSGSVLQSSSLPPLANEREEYAAMRSAGEASFDIDALVAGHLEENAADLYARVHRQLDRRVLQRVLAYTGGNQFRAARLLGIARQTLRTKLREAGLYVASAVRTNEAFEPSGGFGAVAD